MSELLCNSKAWALRVDRMAPMVAVLMSAVCLFPVRSRIHPKAELAALRPAMVYLSNHSPQGSQVFIDDWDIFPVCFYYNTHNTYGVGLDPMFTISRYPELWERYRLITRGKTPAELGPPFNVLEKRPVTLDDIRAVFHSQYVLVTERHSRFYRQLTEQADRFKLIYPEAMDDKTQVQPAIALFEVLPQESVP